MVMMQRIVERHGSTPVPKKTSTEMVLPIGKTVMMAMQVFSEVPMGRLSPVRASIVHRYSLMDIARVMASTGLIQMVKALLKPIVT